MVPLYSGEYYLLFMRTRDRSLTQRENQVTLAEETRGPVSWGCDGGPSEAVETRWHPGQTESLSGCQRWVGAGLQDQKKSQPRHWSLRSTACSEDSAALVEGGGRCNPNEGLLKSNRERKALSKETGHNAVYVFSTTVQQRN